MDVKVNILSAFVNSENEFGNPVGVVLDEKQELSSEDRQKVAAKIDFSETVFIDSSGYNKTTMFNPIKEVKFAGHALIGTSYFVNRVLKKEVSFIDCKGGHVKTWQESDLTWIEANLEGTPPWKHKEFKTPHEIEHLSTSVISEFEHTMVWAWIDKQKGIIRARTFAPDWGIPEDQANGSGSMQLASMVGRKIEIKHGDGSIIYAELLGNNVAKIGGRVVADKTKVLKI